MDFKARLQYQQEAEEYLQEHKVYDLFEYMLRELIVERPENPAEFLMNKLDRPRRRRLFIVGGSGKERRMLARGLGLEVLSLCKILRQHMKDGGQYAEEIVQSWKSGIVLEDLIVLELLMSEIDRLEASQTGYILEGVPRTRLQALSLQKAGIIPEKVFVLPVDEETFKQKSVAKSRKHQGEDPEAAGLRAWQQYSCHMNEIKDVYVQTHFELQPGDNLKERVLKIMDMKMKSSAPRQPPRVAVIGPPGSGKSTQALKLAHQYGLSFVSVLQLLRDQVNRNTDLGREIASIWERGEEVSEGMVIELLEFRLKETDCLMNGWVLDGYPITINEARVLRSTKIEPSFVFMLETKDESSYMRLENRKLDPETGTFYRMDRLPEDLEIFNRLIGVSESDHGTIKQGLLSFKENAEPLKTHFKTVLNLLNGENDAVMISEIICDTIENSVDL